MKLVTRMVLLFLTAFVLVTAAYAEHNDTDIAYPVTDGNIYFDKSSGTVTDCDENVTEVVIPAQIDGVSVISIQWNAFYYCSNLISVEIPDSVTSIGESAFYRCSALKNVEIPYSVTSIRYNVFGRCSSLTSVTIPSSVTSIGDDAFLGCSSLTSLEIPSGVTSIGENAFLGCSSITNINVESGNRHYISLDGILFDKNQSKIICYPAGKTEQSYKISDSVTSIGTSAFSYCDSLTSVQISNSVTSIGGYAFLSCSSLTNMKIPNSVVSIGYNAFTHCSSLKNIEIPNSVISIGDNAFSECADLCDVYYSGSEIEWNQIANIEYSRLISSGITIHYNVSMPDTPSAPEFQVPDAPTVGGHALSKADLSGLTEISVPVTISADTPTQVTLCVPFFDGGKFLGMGFVTATMDNTTQSVTVPVTGDVSGAGKLKVIFVDADFRPLSAAAGFDIPA